MGDSTREIKLKILRSDEPIPAENMEGRRLNVMLDASGDGHIAIGEEAAGAPEEASVVSPCRLTPRAAILLSRVLLTWVGDDSSEAVGGV